MKLWVERPWDLEERQNVTSALLDPEKVIERFIGAVTNADITYKPTGRVWAAIFSGKLGLKWTEEQAERMLSTLHCSDWMKEEDKLRNGELSGQQ